MTNTYTIAKRADSDFGAGFIPVKGIPQNMTLAQAEKLASKARGKGFDVVAFNMGSV